VPAGTRAAKEDRPPARGWVRGFLSKLGPGLVSGAADDDPSGIGTYSIAGAQFGYSPLWIAWFTFPLMAAVQMMCARLGLVSGRGLGGLIRIHYGRAILWPACALLVVANVVNIGADLGGMAAATGMITGIRPLYIAPFYALLIGVLVEWSSYRRIATVFKWLTLILFAYLVAAFLAHPDWHSVLHRTLVPRIQWSGSYIATFVAILGTTISPYLFFWQATQEVEEDRDRGKTTVAMRQGATDTEEKNSGIDVITGMLFSNLIMYFIILTTAATLNAHGQTHITTTEQAAEALRPLAGKAAYLLFTVGLIGTGMLSVPVLAGSTAFAIAEGAGWRNSLKYRQRGAPEFYAILFASLLVGLGLNYVGFGVVSMLFWSAVVNGVLAPPLIVLVVLMSCDRKVMGDRVASPLVRWLGWLAAAVMSVAAIAMFATIGSA
jgi:NRAMP (natural resistance-associated macrophage protein)-like metal ion transporter